MNPAIILGQICFLFILIFSLSFNPSLVFWVTSGIVIVTCVYLRVNGWKGFNIRDADGRLTILIILFGFSAMYSFSESKNWIYFVGSLLQVIAMALRIDYTSFFKKE